MTTNKWAYAQETGTSTISEDDAFAEARSAVHKKVSGWGSSTVIGESNATCTVVDGVYVATVELRLSTRI